MANQEQLMLLRQAGVAVWNQWRQDHPECEIDLSRADLRETDLSSVNLSRADLRGTNFRGADLSGADLSEAALDKADFTASTTRRCIGYPQVSYDLLLDDPLLTFAFEEE